MQLEEDNTVSSFISEVVQKIRQAWVNRNIKFKVFNEGDWVMLYNSKLGPHPGKLKLRYIGLYKIIQFLGQGTFKLEDIFGIEVQKPVNGFRLKQFVDQPPTILGVGHVGTSKEATIWKQRYDGDQGEISDQSLVSDQIQYSKYGVQGQENYLSLSTNLGRGIDSEQANPLNEN